MVTRMGRPRGPYSCPHPCRHLGRARRWSVSGSSAGAGRSSLAVVKVMVCPRYSLDGIEALRRGAGRRIGGDLLLERLEIGGGRIRRSGGLRRRRDGHRQFVRARLGRRRSRDAFPGEAAVGAACGWAACDAG